MLGFEVFDTDFLFELLKAHKAAYEIAMLVHRDHIYGNGRYINHLLRVAQMATVGRLPSEYIDAALLHDSVEDTEKEDRARIRNLINDNCGSKVLNMVEALTHDEGKPYNLYIRNIRDSRYTLLKVVKTYDIFDNLSNLDKLENGTDRIRKHRKYVEALSVLGGN